MPLFVQHAHPTEMPAAAIEARYLVPRRARCEAAAKKEPHKSFPQRWHCFNLHAHFAHNEYMPLLVP
jgi:hypothetical protein